MAEWLSEIQESLKQELTCSICLELMEEPKTLPCNHVCCKQCLKKHASRCQATSTPLQCPECRKDMPNNIIDNLPTDFRTVRLKEVYDRMLQVNKEASTVTLPQESEEAEECIQSQCKLAGNLCREDNLVSCNLHEKQIALYCITCRDVFCQDCEKSHRDHNYHYLIDDNTLKQVNSRGTSKTRERKTSNESSSNLATPACKEHKNHELVVYCETCNELLCHLCIADKHEDHHYTKIKQAAEKERQHLEEVTTSVTDLEPQLSTALISVTQVKATIAAQARDREMQVDHAFESLFGALRKQKQLIQQQIVDEVEQKNKALGQQREQLTSVYSDLLEAAAEDSPKNLSNEEILLQKEERVAHLKQLRQKIRRLPLNPAVTADIGASLMMTDIIKTCCKKCQLRYRIPDISRCQLTGTFLRAPETDKVHLITLQLLDSRGEMCLGNHKIEAKLRCVRDQSETLGRIIKLPTSDGAYNIIFDSVERGRQEFSIFVNDTILPQCPIALFVRKPPEKLTAPVKIISNPHSPSDLLFHGGNMLVFETHPQPVVSIYNKEGEKTGTMKPGGGVAVDRATNTYFVSDYRYPQIHKFNEKGELLQSKGAIGRGPGQLLSPNGLDFHNGELYVTDSANHWIHVYDRDLNFLRQFGRNGTANGYFKIPQHVIADEDGTLYITDCFNHRIQVMSPTGQFIHSIQKVDVRRNVYPRTPVTVRIHMGLLYITECERSVSIFTKSGKFIANFGQSYLDHPEGIDIDEDGYIYITSDKKNQIVVF